MSEDDDIGYSGPDDEWVPGPGKHINEDDTPAFVPYDGTYADEDRLDKLLSILANRTRSIIELAEETLMKRNLFVPEDSQLMRAQEIEWPSSLGTAKNYISYKQYKAMLTKQTRSANYITKKYKEAIRSSRGSAAVDILFIVDLINGEIKNIRKFLTDYTIKGSNDVSQQRAIELFQDWAQNALRNTGQLRFFFSKKSTEQEGFSQEDLDRLSSRNARDYQAVLQVQLNQANAQLDKIGKELKAHLSHESDTFYNDFLGPAVKFRRQVSSGISMPPPNMHQIHDDVYRASGILDLNTKYLFSDALKRNGIYLNKMGMYMSKLSEANRLRHRIKALSYKGVAPKSTFVDRVDDTSSEDQYFEEYVNWLKDAKYSATPTTKDVPRNAYFKNRFDSGHNLLPGRGEDDAHPQYLLKSGGHITGNIFLDDGATIDGVSVSEHAHTGGDGSPKIDGSAIVPGTIKTETVDLSEDPGVVTGVALSQFTSSLSASGEYQYEAVVTWDSDNATGQFEIQVTRIV